MQIPRRATPSARSGVPTALCCHRAVDVPRYVCTRAAVSHIVEVVSCALPFLFYAQLLLPLRCSTANPEHARKSHTSRPCKNGLQRKAKRRPNMPRIGTEEQAHALGPSRGLLATLNTSVSPRCWEGLGNTQAIRNGEQLTETRRAGGATDGIG